MKQFKVAILKRIWQDLFFNVNKNVICNFKSNLSIFFKGNIRENNLFKEIVLSTHLKAHTFIWCLLCGRFCGKYEYASDKH
jgi:hypothetical protein